MPNTLSGTLVANTVATVNFTPTYPFVMVYNLGSTPVYGTSDGTVPTVAGAGCFVVPGGMSLKVINQLSSFYNNQAEATPAGTGTVVKLISAGTPGYSVDPMGQTPGSTVLSTDLITISGLTPSNNDVLQRKSGAWTNRSPSQVKTDLSLTQSDVGLANVDNTSDTNKPVSTAQQTALNAKVATTRQVIAGTGLGGGGALTGDVTITANVTTVASRTGDVVLTKSDVGLANVDNTSDANKPVSTATQTALNAKIATTSLSSATPQATGAAGVVGVSTSVARDDHVHAGVVADKQTFTNTGSSTWTKPSVGTIAIIDVIAGGGGGGAGRRGAASTIRGGGAGGGSGGRVASIVLPLSALGSTETVTVGIGGTAGTTASANSNDGGNGGNGGNSSFGSWLVANGGSGGGGGTATGATGGNGGWGDGFSASGVNSSATGAAGSNANSAYAASAGGASGGGVTSGDGVSAGGAGAGVGMRNYTGGGSAGTAGNNGGTATNVTAGVPLPGASGGGGGSSITGVGGNGAAGGTYGAGGSGGGASLNGSNSGAGGAGGQGIVQVIVM